MAIRITDSVKPGYNRVNLDLIGKSGPPESTSKVGSAVLNQARADGAAVSARYWRFAGTGYSIAYDVEIKDAAGNNKALLSLGATATADSTYPGNPPENAIDGTGASEGDKWASANTVGAHWIEVDLGKVCDIAGIRIVPRNYDDSILGWETNPIVITAGNTPAPATVVKTLVPRIDFPYGTVAPIVAALSDTSTT